MKYFVAVCFVPSEIIKNSADTEKGVCVCVCGEGASIKHFVMQHGAAAKSKSGKETEVLRES